MTLRAFRDFGATSLLHPGIARDESDGEFAPFDERFRVCKDGAGRWRARHLWANSDEGAICCFCDCLKDVLILKR